MVPVAVHVVLAASRPSELVQVPADAEPGSATDAPMARPAAALIAAIVFAFSIPRIIMLSPVI
jgi:hypothetical protein